VQRYKSNGKYALVELGKYALVELGKYALVELGRYARVELEIVHTYYRSVDNNQLQTCLLAWSGQRSGFNRTSHHDIKPAATEKISGYPQAANYRVHH
jgi:hypothetical protein